MKIDNSATPGRCTPLSPGIRWGLLGVVGFSLTMPLTRMAVDEGALSPLLVGAARAVIAGLLSIALLAVTRSARPTKKQWLRLTAVAGGIVIGFPLLTSFALTRTEASHSAVVVAVLPAATAMAVTLRTREAQSGRFWMASGLGAVSAIGFAIAQNGSLTSFGWPDLLLIAAVVVAAVGYAEGGLLARELGAWQTTSWALVAALPVMAVLTACSLRGGTPDAGLSQWCAFGYLALISMFLAFFAWYRGLALGPMATVSQTQLLQPVLSLGWAALLLGEHVGLVTLIGGAVVIVFAGSAVRARTQVSTTAMLDAALMAAPAHLPVSRR